MHIYYLQPFRFIQKKSYVQEALKIVPTQSASIDVVDLYSSIFIGQLMDPANIR